jgi:ABC-type antimicrobial peptide transport system permease subunit
LVAHLQRTYAAFYDVQSLPNNLVNFGQAVDFPLLLGITIALFGIATLTHLLFVSVTRRRRQFALLKVLGFVRRQVRSVMCWQAATIAVIGVAFGVPLGLLVGKIVWKDFAVGLGAVPLAVVPAVSITVLAAVIIGGAILLALVPANLAARISPAEALREV